MPWLNAAMGAQIAWAATNRSQYIDICPYQRTTCNSDCIPRRQLQEPPAKGRRLQDTTFPEAQPATAVRKPPRRPFRKTRPTALPGRETSPLHVCEYPLCFDTFGSLYRALFARSSNFRPQSANHSQTFQTKGSSYPWGCTRNYLRPASHLSTSVRNCTTATSITGRPYFGELAPKRITAARHCRCCGGFNTHSTTLDTCMQIPCPKTRDLHRKIFFVT
jgi:hypothetical protein